MKQVDVAIAIINNLNNFGRDAGSIKNSQIHINTIIIDSLNLLGYQLHMSNIKVIKELDDNLPPILCNPIQIEQVLVNLFSNAKDAMLSESTKNLTIRSFQKDNQIIIDVKDSGKGIPPSNIDKIFNSFFTTKELGKGTGLGLSISNGIIQNHGGQITVKSEEGKGTSFHIELPVNRNESG